MVAKEQSEGCKKQRLSTVLWDTFTGSASYRDIFRRTLNPLFLGTLIWETMAGFLSFKVVRKSKEIVCT